MKPNQGALRTFALTCEILLGAALVQSAPAQTVYSESGTYAITSDTTISIYTALAGPAGDPPLVELNNNATLTIGAGSSPAYLLVGYTGSSGNAGIFTLNSGTIVAVGVEGASFPGSAIAVGDSGGIGTLNVAGGLVDLATYSSSTKFTNLSVGTGAGSGTLNQTSGTIALGTNFSVGSGTGSTGSYTITGGSLQGFTGTGSGIMYVGDDGGSGTLNFGGSATASFAASSGIWIGGDNVGPANSTGLFHQTGGTFSFAGNGIYLAGQAGDTGTYQLDGGTLQIGGANKIVGGAGTARLNFGGGTLQVVGSNFSTGVASDLTAGSTSVIDTNGLNAAFSGSLSGAGTLDKVGSGTMTITGNNALTGEVYVVQGALAQTAGQTGINYFGVGSGAGASGLYSLSSGTLNVSQAMQVGDWSGSGTVNQTGGVVNIAGTGTGASFNIGNQGGVGVYNLSGGTLNLGGANGGLYSLGRTQSASQPASQGTLNLSGSGLLDVQSGNFVIGDRDGTARNGTGTVNQTGGVFRVENGAGLFLAGAAPTSGTNIYNLASGTLEIGGSSLNPYYTGSSSYQFNLGGGTIKVIGSNLTTSVSPTLVSSSTSYIDTNGFDATFSGAFGGSNAILVKTGSGNLALTAATNAIDSFFVTAGNANQTTGTLTSYEMGIGSGAGSVGSYAMSGGSLILAAGTPPPIVGGMASSLRVGDFGGSGTFNQTGGSVTINGALNIGNQGGHGTYNINGGTLNFVGSSQSALGRTSGSSASSGGSTGALNLSGTGTINITDTAMLVLSNWYPSSGITQGTGILTQTGGTLAVGNTATLYLTGAGDGTYNLNAGTLQIGSNSLQAIFGQNGAYHFNLGGGTIKVSGTDLTTSVDANLTNGTADIGVASKIDTNGLNATWSGSLNGASGGLIKAGSGTLTFNGAGSRTIGYFNTDQGVVAQTSGTTTSSEFVVGSNYAVKSGTYSLSGGVLNLSGTTQATSQPSMRIGDYGGTGVFNQTGGLVSVTAYGANGASLHIGNQGGTGTYNISSGTLAFTGPGFISFARSTGTYAATSGTLNLSGSSLIDVSGSGGATQFIIGDNISSANNGYGVVNQTGGILRIRDGANLFLAGFAPTNSGTDTYNLTGGSLEIGGSSLNGAYNGSSPYLFNLGGGTIKVVGSNLNTSANITVNGSASTIDTQAFSGTFSGSLLGSGTVTKIGSGAMSLNGASTASISVSEGQLTGAGSTSGNVSIASGATFAGKVSVGGTTTIASGATFSPGFSPAAVYNGGDLVMDGTMVFELSGTAAGTGSFTAPVTGDYDQVLYGGGISIGDDAVVRISSLGDYLPLYNDTFTLLLAGGSILADPDAITIEGTGGLANYIFGLSVGTGSWNGSGSYNTLELTVLAVPEPSTWTLLGISVALVLWRVRRRA